MTKFIADTVELKPTWIARALYGEWESMFYGRTIYNRLTWFNGRTA